MMASLMPSKRGPFARLSAVERAHWRVEASRELPVEHHRPTLSSEQVPRWTSGWVTRRGPAVRRCRRSGQSRGMSDVEASWSAMAVRSPPPAREPPVPRRRVLDRHPRPRDVERGDAHEIPSPISNAYAAGTPPSGTVSPSHRSVNERVVAGRDRLWHRDARREGRPLKPEHVLDAIGPAAVDEIQLLHRERPLVGVEPVHPVGEPAVDTDHRPDRRAEMRKVHPTHSRSWQFIGAPEFPACESAGCPSGPDQVHLPP